MPFGTEPSCAKTGIAVPAARRHKAATQFFMGITSFCRMRLSLMRGSRQIKSERSVAALHYEGVTAARKFRETCIGGERDSDVLRRSLQDMCLASASRHAAHLRLQRSWLHPLFYLRAIREASNKACQPVLLIFSLRPFDSNTH